MIDPWRSVDVAVVSHAHSDHVCAGCKRYICTPETGALLRARLGDSCAVESLPYGHRVQLGDAEVSLHPSGHVLGSAQVRVEPRGGGPVWVVTADYKLEDDGVSAPFESVQADILLTESTFGLPIFRWPSSCETLSAINSWWRENAARGTTSVVLAYSLGKAQRVLKALDPTIGPIGVHESVARICRVYESFGVHFPEYGRASASNKGRFRGMGMLIVPPAARSGPRLHEVVGGSAVSIAMASGWMAIRSRLRWSRVDRGFILSDHADWPGLLSAVMGSSARCVGVTHGYASALARYLSERGFETFTVPTRFRGEADEADIDFAASEDRA